VEAIPNHPSYRAVERSDTASMIEPARYAARAT